MSEKISIYSDSWCEIVFAGKNKEYGAFQLRKNSGVRHLKAMIIAILLVVFSICTPLIMKSVLPEKRVANIDVNVISNVVAPNKADTKKEEIKIEEQILPKYKSSMKFTPYQIAEDSKASNEDDIKSQEELNKSKFVISSINIVGTDDGTGVDFNELKVVQLDVDNKKVEDKVYTWVEQDPQFIADESLNSYLSANVKYPDFAIQVGISGTVYVKFIVEPDGSLSNVSLERGIGGGCDEEAIRVIKGMPQWKPGKQNGNAVRVKLVIPIKFLLK